MLGWGGRSLGKYEAMKRMAEEQNQVKDEIHKKFTSNKPGDRVLSKHEYRTMGLAWSDRERGRGWYRLLRLVR